MLSWKDFKEWGLWILGYLVFFEGFAYVGHAKGLIHFCFGDIYGGLRCLLEASRVYFLVLPFATNTPWIAFLSIGIIYDLCGTCLIKLVCGGDFSYGYVVKVESALKKGGLWDLLGLLNRIVHDCSMGVYPDLLKRAASSAKNSGMYTKISRWFRESKTMKYYFEKMKLVFGKVNSVLSSAQNLSDTVVTQAIESCLNSPCWSRIQEKLYGLKTQAMKISYDSEQEVLSYSGHIAATRNQPRAELEYGNSRYSKTNSMINQVILLIFFNFIFLKPFRIK